MPLIEKGRICVITKGRDAGKEAVKKAVTEKILIITGSPGTGKSTILNVAINYLFI